MNFEARCHSRNKHGCHGGPGSYKGHLQLLVHGCSGVGVFPLAPHFWKNWENTIILTGGHWQEDQPLCLCQESVAGATR